MVSAQATAVASQWHTDAFTPYTGQIILRDDEGRILSYDRYTSGQTPTLFGATSVQSPIVVVAAKDFDVGNYLTGVARTKFSCPTGQTWEVAMSVVNACFPGVAHDISGVNLSYTETSAQWTPRLHVHVRGMGWQAVNNNAACGVIQAVERCR